MRVAINEDFTDPLGTWNGYDTYDFTQRATLANQKHTDLRVFQQQNVATGGPISGLNPFTMADLADDTMTALTGTVIVEAGELWNTSTVGPDAARQNMRTLSASLGANTTTTIYSRMDDYPVDLSSYDPTDFISVALPSFTAASYDLPNCFLRLGDGTNFAQVPFSASVNPFPTNTELRVPLSAFTGIDKSHITDVGFIIKTTAATTFVAMSYRAVSKNWKFLGLDLETRYNKYRRTAPPNGDLTTSAVFPMPTLWRGSSPPAADDPKPIDGEVGVIFKVGSMTGTNQFAVYFRELTEDYLTMGDLDGDPMSNFDGNVQPDVGTARYNQTTQGNLDLYAQDELSGRSQYDIERVPDYLSASWIQFLLQWSSTGTTVTVTTTENVAYTFNVAALTPQTEYVFIAKLEENSARAFIYALDAQHNVGARIFDSTAIIDDFNFKRRKGRFGWWASLTDADAYIDAINDRGFTYAEYRSVPFKSITPVVGAELFAGTSPNIEHYESFVPGFYNGSNDSTVERDTARSVSGESWRVTDFGSQVFQGVETNAFLITDFANTEIDFDLFYPSSAIQAGGNIAVALLDEQRQRSVPLLMPQVIPDQWQHIHIRMPLDAMILTGIYSVLIYGTSPLPTTWWVDNMSVITRTVTWEARSVVDDPWDSNDARWTPFRNVLNRDSGGILFPRRGTNLQVRAKGVSPTAVVNRINFKAKYAELGKFKPSGVTAVSANPTPSFTSTASGALHGLRFTSTSTDDGRIILTEWNFGDGATGIGESVDHIYAAAGNYNVTIIVTDDTGNKAVSSTSVTVP